MAITLKKPFLGTAYYPEDWPETLIDEDIAKMKECGIRVARIAEFAWGKMEPEEGTFDFGWLHTIVDKLGAAGIGVVLGTPSAAPPYWLTNTYPDSRNLWSSGRRMLHGGRQGCCRNHPDYRRLSIRIAEKMAREFGRDPAVVGWQIDNEIYAGGAGCTCDNCIAYFHRYLEKRYGTVDKLNAAWNTGVFSQTYPSFDDVVVPIDAWHNPHLVFEWKQAHHETDIAFIHEQAEAMRPFINPDVPIGTDMMPTVGMSHEKMLEKLDVAQFNHYNTAENLPDITFWFDFERTLKDRPFWNTETATVWNGSTAINQVMKPEGFTRINSWLPVAQGAECNMYWLWRQHWGGQELMHGAVLWPDGQYFYAVNEVKQTAQELERAGDFLTRTTVKTDVALHCLSASQELIETAPLYEGNDYRAHVSAIHGALRRAGIPVNVIGAAKDLGNYKMLVTPLGITLEDENGGHALQDKITAFVQNGGTWVAGPMTDIRNSIGAHYTDAATGFLEKLTGARLTNAIPSDDTVLKLETAAGKPFAHHRWVETFTLPAGAQVSWRVASGHSALNGTAVAAKIPVGRGYVVLCGTFPDDDVLQALFADCADAAGANRFTVSGKGILVVPREGYGASGLVVCETAHENASVVLPGVYRDVLRARDVSGTLQVEPYGVYVLQKI